MLFRLYIYLKKFFQKEDGQGITEYGGVLASSAILVAFMMAVLSPALNSAVSRLADGIVIQLNRMAVDTVNQTH